MAQWRVSYKAEFTGSVIVEADSEDEACDIAETLEWDAYVGNATFEHIEVDWADEIKGSE